jgi:hypothetical protein
VSADVGEEGVVRAKKTSRNRTRSKPLKKATPVRDSRLRTPRKSETAIALAKPATNLAGATVRPASGDPARTSIIEQAAPRVLQSASFGLLVVFGLVVLVVASLALSRYPAARADASALAVRSPDVHVASPQPAVAAQSIVPPVKTIATPVRVGPVDDELPISQVKAPRGTHEKPKKAADERAAGTSPTESIPQTATLFPVAGAGETAGIAPTATTSPSAAVSTPKADTSGLTPVTITGCLEISIDGDRFRLTETEGPNVPKARSWRSGFLRKQPAPLELVQLADPLTARKYVGQRVVATGVVENREMRVHSLQAGGHACSQ